MSDMPQKDPGERVRLQQFGIKDSAYERPDVARWLLQQRLAPVK